MRQLRLKRLNILFTGHLLTARKFPKLLSENPLGLSIQLPPILNNVIANNLAETIHSNTGITHLIFNNCVYLENAFEIIINALNKCKQALRVDFIGVSLNKYVVKYLFANDIQVEAFSLMKWEIDPKMFTHLLLWMQENTKLKKISICQLNEETMNALCDDMEKNKAITHLDLSNNRLSLDAIKRIASMLTQNDTITHLGLSNCDLDDEKFAILAEALTKNDSLLELNINGNSISQSAQDRLCDIGNDNFSLSFVIIENPSPDLSTYLARNHTIELLIRAANQRDFLTVAHYFSKLNIYYNNDQCRASLINLKKEIILSLWESYLSLIDNNIRKACARLMLWVLQDDNSNLFYKNIIGSCASVIDEHSELEKSQKLLNDVEAQEPIFQFQLTQNSPANIEQFLANLHPGQSLAQVLEQDQNTLNNYTTQPSASLYARIGGFFKYLSNTTTRQIGGQTPSI